jgi:predicted aspartyl protease
LFAGSRTPGAGSLHGATRRSRTPRWSAPVTFDESRSAILARARTALRYREDAGVFVARGTGEVSGLPVTWSRVFGAEGRFLETIDGKLGHAAGFDGVMGWRVDETGMAGPLELGDLDDAVVSLAVWSGSWLGEGGPVRVSERVVTRGGATVLELCSAGLVASGRRFRLTLDSSSALPLRLAPEERDDVVTGFADFRPGGMGLIPHVVSTREAWLADTLRLHTIEDVSPEPSFSSSGRAPDDTAFDPAGAAPALRWTQARQPLVGVSIDGRDAGWFLLDTGASALAIDSQLAERLRLPALGRRFVRTADGGAGGPYRRGSIVRIGAMTIRAPLFLELDLSALASAARTRIAGVLGYDLFMRSVVTLGDDDVSIAATADVSPATRWLPLRFQGGQPVIDVRLASAEGSFDSLLGLDTGSAAALTISEAIAPRLALRGRRRTAMRGVSGAVSAGLRRLAWLEIAGERFDDVDVVLAPSGQGAFGGVERLPAIIGSLGMKLLRHFAVVLDYRNRRVALTRQRGPR